MNADSLLTKAERKAIIERLVQHDKEMYKSFGPKELKSIRKLYSTWDDAKLMSVKFR
jgi:hypothetical protein